MREADEERALTDEELRVTELTKRGATMEEVAAISEPAAGTPEEALRLLKEGNARFYGGSARCAAFTAVERRAQVASQTPFAIVLGCADSRVPLEIVFDQGLGDLFGIRVAGNLVGPGTLPSIEYAVRHLKVRAIVVLGHEGCGAVKAAMLSETERQGEPEHVRRALDEIAAAVADLPPIRDQKARLREAVTSHVLRQVELLHQNPVVAQAVADGQIAVAGAFYEISSGAVDFLEADV